MNKDTKREANKHIDPWHYVHFLVLFLKHYFSYILFNCL